MLEIAMADTDRDFLDEMVDERTARNPNFPKLVDAATRRRALLKTLGEVREQQAKSQTSVASRMRSSQSSVARLEGSASDARVSTVDRFAEVLGYQVQWHLVPLGGDDVPVPPVVVHSPKDREARTAKRHRRSR